MTTLYLFQKICLTAKIKGLAAAIKKQKFLMRQAKDAKLTDKYRSYGFVKQHIRADARHHHLALAYMKNMPYKVVEAKCNEKPYPKTIALICATHSFCSLFYIEKEITNIKNWLEPKAEEIPVQEKQTLFTKILKVIGK